MLIVLSCDLGIRQCQDLVAAEANQDVDSWEH